MFIMCDLAKEIWYIFFSFSGLNMSPPSQSMIVSMFTSWNANYPTLFSAIQFGTKYGYLHLSMFGGKYLVSSERDYFQ